MRKTLAIIVAVFLGIATWYLLALRPVDTESEDRQTIKIVSGMTVGEIAGLLKDRNIIRSSLAFKIHTQLKRVQGRIQAGKFVLKPSMSVPVVVSVLQSGIADEAIITIPEGFTVKQIDALLAEKGFSDLGAIVECANRCDFSSFEFLPKGTSQAKRGGILEGYLFPETYFVAKDTFVQKFFLERMLTTFRRRVLKPFADDIEASNRSLHELITMASLIEEETLTDAERPIVSGILWKRYDDGRGLGVDAAVRYVLEKPTEAITARDLNAHSPYNTRKFRGLPPGPIANPGLDSIVAALRPQETEYWYYLHGKDGTIHYAVSNEEHNMNRMEYLR